MMSNRKKERAAFRKLAKFDRNARSRYTYFVAGNADDGYRWSLVNLNDETLCSSDVFADKGACLKSLRTVQRHAATTHVNDDAR